MHELGVAQSVLEIVRHAVSDAKAADVRAVRVRIGALSGVVAESLDFCFGALVAGTPYGGAFLVLERVPVTLRCEACGLCFISPSLARGCPSCDAGRLQMVAGDELRVVDVELDEPIGAPA
jgi:hydrogenase nickel incorporation protein HypA/HybF